MSSVPTSSVVVVKHSMLDVAGSFWRFFLCSGCASLSALAEPPLTREQQAHTVSTMVTVDVYGPGPMSLFRAAADKLPGVHNKEGQLVTDGFLDVCGLVVPVIGEWFICFTAYLFYWHGCFVPVHHPALGWCTGDTAAALMLSMLGRSTCRAIWGCLWPGEERHQPEH